MSRKSSPTKDMTVEDLKAKLRSHSLPTTGKKADLQARLDMWKMPKEDLQKKAKKAGLSTTGTKALLVRRIESGKDKPARCCFGKLSPTPKRKSPGRRNSPRKPVMEAESYFIHDNGGRPFFVSISKNGTASIFKFDIEKYNRDDDAYSKLGRGAGYYNWFWFEELDDDSKGAYYNKLIAKYKPTKIFIGKSVEGPLTRAYEYGRDFDGNTILLEIGPKRYVWIGSDGIYEFQAKAEIVEFQSPVGNNDVPYPFAIDKNHNYYLLLESVIVSNIPENTDPYTYYYDVLNQKGGTPIKKKVIESRLW